MSSRKLVDFFSPARIIIMALCAAVVVATALLALSGTHTGTIPLIDLVFTATSSLCLTGLFTVPLSEFTFFGHCIILTLIQIGGLGLITMTLFFMYLFMDVGLGTSIMASQLLEIDSWKNIRSILLFIITFTFIVEGIGALCLLAFFIQDFPFWTALFYAIFHSVSAFCNAGIWLFAPDMLAKYVTHSGVLSIMMLLIFLGDLGFITIYESMRYFQVRILNKRRHLSLHSKIILLSALFLLVTSSILFWILERDGSLAGLSDKMVIVTTLFNVISFRSAGFLITPASNFCLATLLIIMALGFIGSAPASTGGGIKITTFTAFLATIKSAICNRTSVEIGGRQIPKDQINKAVAIVAISIGWILMTVFFLTITETGKSLSDILFETVMAFSNVGIDIGITKTLSVIGKLFIIISMIIGRIGSLTLILAITFNRYKRTVEFSYPEERIMLG